MDIVLDSNTTSWQSISTLTGFAVGDEMSIQNKSLGWCLVFLSDTQPEDDSTEGAILTSLRENYATCTLDLNDPECWVRPVYYGSTIRLHVQEG